ncbi:MAG: ABC transporter ATP-binding protein [Planctomycetes bacterium]|jgi:ABC-2 type transport system ATP-binding protein|nr:ABC transporter ATP-binding protein [Planctomycetota bacterium]
MLETKKLTKRFNGEAAVHKLSLKIEAGEIFALLGPNGSGKTTTINLLLGFLSPDEGEARVDGANVAADTISARRKLAYIPEQVMLYPRFSGVENLDYFSSLGGRRRNRTELLELLARAGLPEEPALRRVSTYSKGMRQKVGIALALATEAKALLLDEPTSGLDPAASHEFSQLLRKLAGDGVAVLMATHDLFRAREDANRIGILRAGQLSGNYTAKELKDVDLEQLYLRHLGK